MSDQLPTWAERFAAHAGVEAPEGMTLGWRVVRPDFTSRGGYRWPFPGGWATDPRKGVDLRKRTAPDNACPSDVLGGVCLAVTPAGAASCGIPLHTVLVTAHHDEDVLGADANKLRVKKALVLEVVDAVAYLSGADLSGAVLSGADLSQAYLSGADLSRAVLSGADLSRADLYGAYLYGAYLSGADLSQANLSGANLSRANLSRADLSRAVLSGADLSQAYLSGADLSGANLSGADLSGAVLYGAYLYGAYLSGADLSQANLSGADLSRAVLYGADLSGADLSGADLSGAVADRYTCWPDGFDPAGAGVWAR